MRYIHETGLEPLCEIFATTISIDAVYENSKGKISQLGMVLSFFFLA